MLRTLFVILLSSFTLVSISQNDVSRADSLVLALDQAKDIEKIKILIELSEEFRFEESGLKYANQALDLAKKLDNPTAQADAYQAIGRYYYVNWDTEKPEQGEQALQNYFKSYDLYKSTNNKSSLAIVLRNIGKTYLDFDSLELSTRYTLQSLQITQEIDEKTQTAETLIAYGEILAMQQKGEEAVAQMMKALEIFQEYGTKNDLILAHNKLGRTYYDLGDYKRSIENYLKEIELRTELNDIEGIAIACHNLGRTHRTIGNFQLALEQFQKSLTFSEQLGDKNFIAINCNEIGLTYASLSRSELAVEDNKVNFNKALEFHERALKLFQNEKNLSETARSFNNIANNYSRIAINQFVAQYGEEWEDSLYQISSNVILSSFGKTIEYYNEALKIFEEIEDKGEIANVNINLGSHYSYARNWSKAREYLNKGLRIAKELNSPYDISLALFQLGEINFWQKNYDLAEQYLLESAKISQELGIKDFQMFSYQKLAKVYEKKEDLPKALYYTKNFNLLKDELFSEQSQKIITEMQTKYESEKKEQEIKLLSNEKALLNSENQRQRLVIFITIGGLLVILVFAGLLINMIRQKQKANKILEEKNELISHQKQEITDSIRYASRIQSAILPSSTDLADSLKDHFVLFLPRDIVSGDFYWFSKIGKKMVLVAADCTGHGVPGAFMSMLGVSFLYEIVNKEGVLKPSEILNMLRHLIKQTLSQTGKQNEQKDGMDISLSVLDLENMKLEWAGAFNSLYLVRNSELIEYKADKMPVAIHINDHMSFTNQEINLLPGDTFYMFSDGFSDQFGGPDGRKFMSKKFKQLLVEINPKTMEEQKEAILQAHLKWRTGYEQIDDIVVFGVRV